MEQWNVEDKPGSAFCNLQAFIKAAFQPSKSQDSSGPSTVPCVVARLTMENYLRALVGGGGMPRRCPTHGDFPLELEAQLAEARVRRRRLQGRVRDYERRLMQQRRAAAAHQMQVSLPLCTIFMSSRSRPARPSLLTWKFQHDHR